MMKSFGQYYFLVMYIHAFILCILSICIYILYIHFLKIEYIINKFLFKK